MAIRNIPRDQGVTDGEVMIAIPREQVMQLVAACSLAAMSAHADAVDLKKFHPATSRLVREQLAVRNILHSLGHELASAYSEDLNPLVAVSMLSETAAAQVTGSAPPLSNQ